MSATLYAVYLEEFVIPSPLLIFSLVDVLGCNLDWDTYSSSDFTSYKVYQSNTPGVTELSTLLGTIFDVGVSSWHDESASGNWLIRYYAVLLTTNGQTVWSNEVEVEGQNKKDFLFRNFTLIRG